MGIGKEGLVPDRVEMEIGGDLQAVRNARAFVSDTLAAWELEELTDVAVLLTSEVVTNAIKHARSAFLLAVQHDPSQLLVEVQDRSTERPIRKQAPAEAESGRGLMLVEALASHWGSRLVEGGKVVWFTLMAAWAPPRPAKGQVEL